MHVCKFYNVIKNMYSKVELQVKVGDVLTHPFKSLWGVRQGDVLSPTLFNIFVNDIPDALKDCAPAHYDNNIIQCLLYADDLIMFSETIEGLQKALDNVSGYCRKWKMDINIEKTKIMCLNQKDKVQPQFKYNQINIKFANEYKYLGIIFSNNGTFKSAIQDLYNKGLKAYFKLTQILNPFPNIGLALHLFDHLIKPVLLYGCEIWGPVNFKCCEFVNVNENINYHKRLRYQIPLEHKYNYTSLEKLHLKFCKEILGVNNKTSNLVS